MRRRGRGREIFRGEEIVVVGVAEGVEGVEDGEAMRYLILVLE